MSPTLVVGETVHLLVCKPMTTVHIDRFRSGVLTINNDDDDDDGARPTVADISSSTGDFPEYVVGATVNHGNSVDATHLN